MPQVFNFCISDLCFLLCIPSLQVHTKGSAKFPAWQASPVIRENQTERLKDDLQLYQSIVRGVRKHDRDVRIMLLVVGAVLTKYRQNMRTVVISLPVTNRERAVS